MTTTKWMSQREARDLFRAAKLNEQQMYPAADWHRQQHGFYPAEYLQAQHETARAFEHYVDAGWLFGITVAV